MHTHTHTHTRTHTHTHTHAHTHRHRHTPAWTERYGGRRGWMDGWVVGGWMVDEWWMSCGWVVGGWMVDEWWMGGWWGLPWYRSDICLRSSSELRCTRSWKERDKKMVFWKGQETRRVRKKMFFGLRVPGGTRGRFAEKRAVSDQRGGEWVLGGGDSAPSATEGRWRWSVLPECVAAFCEEGFIDHVKADGTLQTWT
jgi:hypothetical protein